MLKFALVVMYVLLLFAMHLVSNSKKALYECNYYYYYYYHHHYYYITFVRPTKLESPLKVHFFLTGKISELKHIINTQVDLCGKICGLINYKHNTIRLHI